GDAAPDQRPLAEPEPAARSPHPDRVPVRCSQTLGDKYYQDLCDTTLKARIVCPCETRNCPRCTHTRSAPGGRPPGALRVWVQRGQFRVSHGQTILALSVVSHKSW